MANKLYQEQSVQNIANAIREPFGDSTTYKISEMAPAINNLADRLKSFIPHRKTTGNPLTVSSLPLKPKELLLDGDTKQETTTGKNKYNKDGVNFDGRTGINNFNGKQLASNTFVGASCYNLITKNNRCQLYFKGEIGKTYYLSFSSNSAIRTIKAIGNDGIITETLATQNKITMTTELIGITLGRINDTDYSDAEVLELKNSVQIEEGSTATSYEPYTGGQPSPSPDYPQEIRNVKSTSGVLNVVKSGKNLLDFNNLDYNDFIVYSPYFAYCEIDTNHIEALTGKLFLTETQQSLVLGLTDETLNFYGDTRVLDNGTLIQRNFDFSSSEKVYLYIGNGQRVDVQRDLETLKQNYNLLIQSASISDTSYEPYKTPQTIPFQIGQTEFCKIGDTTDKLWVNLRTGEYGKTSNIGKVVLDGSESGWRTPSQFEGTFSASRDFPDLKRKSSYSGDFLSNYFIEKSFTSHEEGITKSSEPLNYDILIIRININKVTTLAEFKQWLSTHNTEVYYVKATPTTETLGTLSNENLAKFVLYSGTNNIELTNYDNNGAEPIIELDYYYDWNELTNALLEMGGE